MSIYKLGRNICSKLQNFNTTSYLKNGQGNLNQVFLRMSSVKVGDEIPSIEVYETTPATTVNVREFCGNRKVLIFAVPGAFTPGCTKTHLPGYLANFEKLKEKGIEEIACVAVNDAFVVAAWGQEKGTADKIRMFADTNGEFTKALGVGQDLAVLGGFRSKRYSMLVENGIIKHLNIEPDGKGLSCSLAERAVTEF